jgi:cytochrome c553
MKPRSLYRSALGVFSSFWLIIGLCACKPTEPADPGVTHKETALTSPACAKCHAEQFEAWKNTDHALANRLPRPEHKVALDSFPGGMPEYDKAVALMILGHKPIWQPLIPAPGGRWQPHELAYETATGEWFNVFGQENRQPGEWGHWTGRGMNWNTMCAQCHMTGYKPNYDVATDSFHSTWIEQGIGCIQCHGKPAAGHGQSPPR